MDDLQRLKDFQSTEPAPTESARKTARAALARAISAETVASRRGRILRRPGVRPMALAAAAVAVAAIALIGVFGRGGSSDGGPAKETGPKVVLVSSKVAQRALRHLASSIVPRSLTPGPGQYLYSDWESNYPTYSGSCVTNHVDHAQWWFGADGSGLQRDTEEAEQFTSSADRARCLKADPNMQLRDAYTANNWAAPNCLMIRPTPGLKWSDLSSDPHVLLGQLRKLTGQEPTPGRDFLSIGMFLRLTDTPPRVRSALYRAAALIPGITLLGTVKDHDGRAGLGIRFPSQSPFTSGPHAVPGQTAELIFDQHTGELLGEQGTKPRFWAVYLDQKVVDELPSTPPPLGDPCKQEGAGVGHDIPGGSIMNGTPITP